MSDAMRTLRDGAKRVRELHDDLQPPTMARRDWKTEVYAPQSLGDDKTKVELWYLAGLFLLAWHDWHTMRGRYRGYFGIEDHETPFPKNWKPLDERCIELAFQLLHNKDLEELIVDDWLMTGVIQDDKDSAPSLRDVVHVVIQNHRRWHLMRDTAEGHLDRQSRVQEALFSPEPVWPRCLRLVRRLNDETVSACRRLDELLGGSLRYHLRRYRYSNLSVSWLDEFHEDDTPLGVSGSRSGSRTGSHSASRSGSRLTSEASDLGESALNQLLSERIVIPSVDQYLAQLEDDNARGTVRHMLERISRAIGEVGFDDFVEDVASGELRGGPQSLVGVSAINLIPSKTRGPCQRLLLAVSKGDKKSVGFTNVMREVRTHLINCQETKSVVVLCDYWHPGMLEEHIGDLRAQHKRGVRFLFLMAGVPGRTVSPVAVDLGMTP